MLYKKITELNDKLKCQVDVLMDIIIMVLQMSKKAESPVRYREATQLCGLEEQLQRQRESRDNRPLPSEQDLARSA